MPRTRSPTAPTRWSRSAATAPSTSAVQAVAGTGVAFGVIPAGTGNDFADRGRACRPTRWPRRRRSPTRSTPAATRAGRPGPDRPARTATSGGSRAVLGAGFDALVNERANAMRWPKGRRRYDIAIFAELLRLRAAPVPAHPRRRGRSSRTRSWSRSATPPRYGGGMRMCPAADPTDGLLDVVVGRPDLARAPCCACSRRCTRAPTCSHPGGDRATGRRSRSTRSRPRASPPTPTASAPARSPSRSPPPPPPSPSSPSCPPEDGRNRAPQGSYRPSCCTVRLTSRRIPRSGPFAAVAGAGRARRNFDQGG